MLRKYRGRGKYRFDRGFQICIVCKKVYDIIFKNKICKFFFYYGQRFGNKICINIIDYNIFLNLEIYYIQLY